MPEPYSRHRKPIRLSLGELTHRRLADLAERLGKSRSQVVDDAMELADELLVGYVNMRDAAEEGDDDPTDPAS